jgi:hypothetical protein
VCVGGKVGVRLAHTLGHIAVVVQYLQLQLFLYSLSYPENLKGNQNRNVPKSIVIVEFFLRVLQVNLIFIFTA